MRETNRERDQPTKLQTANLCDHMKYYIRNRIYLSGSDDRLPGHQVIRVSRCELGVGSPRKLFPLPNFLLTIGCMSRGCLSEGLEARVPDISLTHKIQCRPYHLPFSSGKFFFPTVLL